MEDQSPWMSPYAYCSNNPINRIDPTGLKDYRVDADGNITLLKDQTNSIKGKDRLIVANSVDDIKYGEDGSLTNTHHTTSEGTFKNIKKGKGYDYFSVSGNTKAEGIFTFLAENTDVEWGKVSYGKSSNYISTSHSPFENGSEKLADNLFRSGQGASIKSIDHSHPNLNWINPLPSGWPESGPVNKGDKEFAGWLYKYHPSEAAKIQLRVYRANGQGYIRYDNKKIHY